MKGLTMKDFTMKDFLCLMTTSAAGPGVRPAACGRPSRRDGCTDVTALSGSSRSPRVISMAFMVGA
jgi:hypothetical protein